MSFPLTYFLYAYYGFLVIWVIFFGVGLYHMLKFGFKTLLTLTSTLLICTIALVMLLTSFYYINTIDYWDQPLEIFPAWNNDALEY